MLFRSEDVFKKIKVLSGGEKSRVALAKTLISEANFLLLDEPTNHLDFISENILVQALQQYQGSYIIVSHNRHFISQVANKIWYIESGQIKEYPGTYDEYLTWKSRQISTPEIQKEQVSKPSKPAPVKNNNQDVKKIEKEIERLEAEIQKMEEQKTNIETELANPVTYQDHARFKQLQTEHQEIILKIAQLNQKWENLIDQLA